MLECGLVEIYCLLSRQAVAFCEFAVLLTSEFVVRKNNFSLECNSERDRNLLCLSFCTFCNFHFE